MVFFISFSVLLQSTNFKTAGFLEKSFEGPLGPGPNLPTTRLPRIFKVDYYKWFCFHLTGPSMYKSFINIVALPSLRCFSTQDSALKSYQYTDGPIANQLPLVKAFSGPVRQEGFA